MEKESSKQLMIQEKCKKNFEPVVDAIAHLMKGTENPVIIAVDGRCASGKTTLGYYLQSLFDCNLFHMDDFFLRNG